MMPAGQYYIGDLCYVMSDAEWDDFCSITIQGHRCLSGEFLLNDGRRFATHQTKYGDGLYKDQFGNRYGVDAGLIGCIRIDDIRVEKYNIKELGAIVEFKTDFVTSYEDGVIKFGHISIDTDPEEFEDDDY